MEKFKGLLHRKAFWAVVIIAAAAAVFLGVRHHRMNQMMPDDWGEMAAGGAQMAEVMSDTIRSVVSGTGSVAVAETVNVTAPSGILVQHVLVETGDRVSAGDRIAELNMTSILRALTTVDANISAIDSQLRAGGLNQVQREQLQAERDELAETRTQIQALKDNPYILASIDGVINDLYIQDGAEISRSASTSQNNNQNNGSDSYSGSDFGYGGMMIYGEKTAAAAKISQVAVLTVLEEGDGSGDGGSGEGGSGEGGSGEGGGTEPQTEPTEPETQTPVDPPLQQITDFRRFIIAQPATGNTPQDRITETRYYTGEITWNPSHPTFEPNTAYTATSVLTAKTGYTFEGLVFANMPAGWVYEISDDGTQLTITSVFDKTAPANAPTEPAEPETIPEPETEPVIPDIPIPDYGGGGGIDYGGGGDAGLPSSTTNTNALAVVCTIAKPDTAKITLSVDEADILSVHEGQQATITLDAFADRTFEGTVTRVSQTSSSQGGSAKYTVEITFDRDENMLIGMSASAEIFVANAENVLTIPMLALQQYGEQTFVYTAVDEDGNLTGETEITTGVSDGTLVEVVDGLEEGDTVYYYRIGGDEYEDMVFYG
ncbi:MAG: HlyD family efflux transporter periplasmic adaptor subunit [Lachnospiraceae bacterium]|nr:HlyD family efflux transporter periplasmic adaptor subunit [Lachnospiraceae bacterium]